MIIYLASYPRSGNSWVQSLLFKSFRLITSSIYQHPNREEDFRLFIEIDPKFKFPEISEDIYTSAYTQFAEMVSSNKDRFTVDSLSDADFSFLNHSSIQELLKPYGKEQHYLLSGNQAILEYPLIRQYLAASEHLLVIKTHERPYQTYYPGEKVIQIIRNPGAAFWSYLHFLKDYDGITTTLEDLIFGNIGFGDWSQYQQLWLLERQKRPESFCLVYYEDLTQNSKEQVEKISEFINRPISSVGEVPFEKSHRAWPVMVREGKATNWEKNYTITQLELIWNRHKDFMSILGYTEPKFGLALDSNFQNSMTISESREESASSYVQRQRISELVDQITELEAQVNKNRETLKEQVALLEEVQNNITELDGKLAEATASNEESQKIIEKQDNELFEKEKVIRQLALYQRSSIRHWVLNKLFPQLRRVRFGTWIINKIVLIKYIFRSRLFILDQYAPRQFTLPQQYNNEKHTLRRENWPTLSIVTPSYNQADYLERTIQSVINQTYPNFEYVVQDGGSQDGSKEILEKYSDKLTYWESRPDAGQAQAINLGFEKTTGEIMAYLNSDDVYLPGAIQYVMNFFEKHPNVDVVYGHRIIINEEDQEIGIWVLPRHHRKTLYYADYVPQETLFWRRRIWDRVGGIDESFRFAMDWDLLLRFQDVGANIVRLPRFLAAFRVHQSQKTSHQIYDIGLQEMRAIQTRYFDEINEEIIYDKVKSYRRRATFYHLLYRLGLTKY
jgi:glycosyltransferase involved in cell wall biosynthesis/uncharacterized coiled-coil protein SlyX